MIEVETPDGTIIEFPDGTDNQTIKSVLAKQFAPTASQSEQPGKLQSIGAGAVQGIGDVMGTLARGGDFLAKKALGYSPYDRDWEIQ